MIRDPTELGDVLGVWAHPDDESYEMSCVLASAVDSGARAVCVTATRGELGSQDHERWPPDRMADIRAGEMARAMSVLGVTDHRWLGYTDGSCNSADEEEAVGRVEAIMREVRPKTVVTFGPDEYTNHPDHLAVSTWTTRAFRRTQLAGASLLYSAVTPDQVEDLIAHIPGVNGWAPRTPPSTPLEGMHVDLELGDAMTDRKLAALRAHRSQTELLFAGFLESDLRRLLRVERFRLVASGGSTGL